MKKHTPGPWIHQDRTVYFNGNGLNGHGQRIVAECGQSTWTNIDKENARLIAAAPELLAAAHRALAALRTYEAPNCEAAKELKAAIAKAEGNSI